MILAALVLLAVGAVDLVRLGRGRLLRAVLYGVLAVLLFVAAALVDASGPALVAIALAGAWVIAVPADGSGRAGLWPFAAFAGLVAVSVAVAGARPGVEVGGVPILLPGPDGGTPLDLAVLAAGCGLFLCASSNIAVRAALRTEAAKAADRDGGLKGGRLIGPLERLLVFGLTATGAYTLLAAILAAKGIVRFPEISRDSGEGDRAEYFLVGSLVSWTLGVAAALLVWWAAAAR